MHKDDDATGNAPLLSYKVIEENLPPPAEKKTYDSNEQLVKAFASIMQDLITQPTKPGGKAGKN
jgi:hypothetical protein